MILSNSCGYTVLLFGPILYGYAVLYSLAYRARQ